MKLANIQVALRRSGVDGWLFFDHHRRDPAAYRILGIPDEVSASRRWYYLIPVQGEPIKLVHRIESRALDSLPGVKTSYSSWPDQQEKLASMLRGIQRVAMQYSPQCAIPLVSIVDAGTVELVRGTGVEVVTSADLLQEFEAAWTDSQVQSHLRAGELVDRVRKEAFELIGERLRNGLGPTEYEVQQFIRGRLAQLDLTTDHGPMVAVNSHASDPHYDPARDSSAQIQHEDLVLIDMWAKLQTPGAVYYDITWTGFCGETVPSPIQNVFEVVTTARKAASDFVIRQVAGGASPKGFEVDDVARSYIRDRGFGDYFFHRTGHNIGTEVHGTGANMDNWECHDDRLLIPHTCFSVEPGVYLPEFGIRSEVNVYVGEGSARVTGEEQVEIVRV
ncbi:MAG TPA: M24 family metallopeptidase [Bryobacteraceae bacterium]|jgi:Xaa-Pro aminopeptidase|nr:M24 family metallopeptidase [Bryobacteraceae bacterium]